MQNPTLSQKNNEAKPEINERVKKFFGVVYDEKEKKEPDDDNEPKIKVSTLISRMAFFYEKIRNSVDYKDEHLLRKYAIERILKRQLVIEGALVKSRSEEVATHLLNELIRADYLPNNKIPETKIGEVGEIIEKYVKLKYYSSGNNRDKDDENPTGWIIGLAAAEIEDRLGRSKTAEMIVGYMYEVLEKNIEVADPAFKKDKDIQIYTGIYRNFFRFDRDMMEFILLKYYNRGWNQAQDEQIKKTAAGLHQLKQAINYQLGHPLAKRLNRIIGRYTVFFSILSEVIESDPVGSYNKLKNNFSEFEKYIRTVCENKYKKIRSKLWRAAVRSIIYIFLTKMVLAFILEVPVTNLLGQSINPESLAINVAFPPFLLFLIVIFTRVPSEENTRKIIEGIKEITLAEAKPREPYRVRPVAVKGGGLNFFFGLLYTVTFFASFGFVVWALNKISFNFISITIFLFFLTLVSFFGLRIRARVKELLVTEPKENIFGLLGDFFYTPILAVGKWLSEKFSRMNVLVFVLDFIIEAPFKILVEVTEEWTKYVRERRDEIG